MLALFTQYFSESCAKKYNLGGIRTQDPCYSRTVSYQLDYRGCPNYVKKFSNTNYLIWWKNIKGYAPEVSGIQAPVQLMAHTGPSPLPYRTLQDSHPTQSTSPPASNPSHYTGPVPLGEKARQIPITLSHQGQQKALNLY